MWVDADQRIRQAAPFMAYGEFTGTRRGTCARSGRCRRRRRRTPATPPGPGKVVVVSTTHDPATPYQAGVDLARQLGASLITFDGTQHTAVFNGDECVDTAVVNFLVDATLPAAGLRC